MPRTVLLIGASSAIGRAIAERFARDGDQVVGASLEDAPDGNLCSAVVADCGVQRGAEAAVAAVLELNGSIDVVVAAAGAMPVASVENTTDEQWAVAHRATVDAMFLPLRAALPHMPTGSSVVAVTSVNATLAAPGLAAYAAAKGAVDALVRQASLDYGPRGIRVNAVAPGLVVERELVATTPHATGTEYPLQRVGHPEEVADAVHFLASDAASFITGVSLPVDGGLSVASPAAFVRPDLRDRFLGSPPE